MSDQTTFKVFVRDYSTSIEEWRRAWKAPSSELPPLDENQKHFARRFGISEEDYRRGYLAGLYGQERIRNRSKDLGRVVEEVLGGLGPDYQLIAVVAEMFKDRWVLRIRAPQKIFNVEVQRELGDEVLDSSTLQDIDQLKNLLLSGVGREELIRKHEQV